MDETYCVIKKRMEKLVTKDWSSLAGYVTFSRFYFRVIQICYVFEKAITPHESKTMAKYQSVFA